MTDKVFILHFLGILQQPLSLHTRLVKQCTISFHFLCTASCKNLDQLLNTKKTISKLSKQQHLMFQKFLMPPKNVYESPQIRNVTYHGALKQKVLFWWAKVWTNIKEIGPNFSCVLFYNFFSVISLILQDHDF